MVKIMGSLILISFFLMMTLVFESVAQPIAKPQIVSNLRILESPPYKAGQSITAEFTIRNAGTAPLIFDVLTIGGRLNGTCPQNKCPDFEFKNNVSLAPNGAYTYHGRLMLQAPGNYHFFTAYRTKDGQWNTAIPTMAGVRNTIDVVVSPQAIKPQVNKEEMEKILRRGEEIRAPTEKDCISTRTRQIYDDKVKKNPPAKTVIREGQVKEIPHAWLLKKLWEESRKEAEEECKSRR